MTNFTRKTGWEEVESPTYGRYDTNIANPAFMTVTTNSIVSFSYKATHQFTVEFVVNGADVVVTLPATDKFKMYETPFVVSAGTCMAFRAALDSIGVLGLTVVNPLSHTGSPKIGMNLSRIYGLTAATVGDYVSVATHLQSGLDLILPKCTSLEVIASKAGVKLRLGGFTYTLPNARVVFLPKVGEEAILELSLASHPTLVCCRNKFKAVDTESTIVVPKFL